MIAKPIIAVLFAPAGDARDRDVSIVVGGLGVLERQRRLARRAGASRIIVVGAAPALLPDDRATVVVAEAGAIAGLVADDAIVLMFAPGVVVDERIVAATIAASAPAIAVWPVRGVHAGVERIDAATVSAGVGIYPGAMVRAVAGGLGDWDLAATLLRAALADGGVAVDLATLPRGPDARPLVWALATDVETARLATEALLAAAARERPGWPARFLYPLVEATAVRVLLPVPVAPPAARGVVVGIALLAGIAFAGGWLATGLALALLVAPLDGIADRLARTRLDRGRAVIGARTGRLIDLGWAGAIVAALVVRDGGIAPWALGALLIGFSAAERLQRDFLERVTGRAPADADTRADTNAFDRRFALVAARRDVLLWTWLPFAIAGAWTTGFAVVAAHAMLSFFADQQRKFTLMEQISLTK